jgi:hypothetical protein
MARLEPPDEPRNTNRTSRPRRPANSPSGGKTAQNQADALASKKADARIVCAFFGLAASCLVGETRFIDDPSLERFCIGLFVVFAFALLYVFWELSKPLPIVVRAIGLLLVGGLVCFLGLPFGSVDPPKAFHLPLKVPSTVLTRITGGGSAKPAPQILYEVRVRFSNRASVPEFFVDNRPLRPVDYSPSGIATFRLPAGPHTLLAHYADAHIDCQPVEMRVPATETYPAKCPNS